METKDIIKLITLCLVILLVGFEVGYVCSKSVIDIDSEINVYNCTIPNNYTINYNMPDGNLSLGASK